MSSLEIAVQALGMMLEPTRLLFLSLGVVCGVVLGIIPGIGGLSGVALLLPFTFGMDPYTAFGFLLGLAATTATGDPIPAILFGVPGGAGSAATVLDGLPLAKKGEAGRALGAAYMSSMLGGVFGAILMAALLPIMRPVILFVGAPELLAFAVFGLSMVAILAGKSPLRGIVAAIVGILLSLVGSDQQGASLRWTFGTLYLYEGVPLVPAVLGLYALPELCDLLISRTAIAGSASKSKGSGMLEGAADCFRHWWLVLRCSWLGAAFGAFPGIGGSVIDWLAYGHALKTERGARETFGKGDIRGVIASESANNAKEGGALVPTVAFGVPATASMALLLGAFQIHGLTPGPAMLTRHLDVTYSMVWSIALANILGAGLCFLFSSQFAKLATLRYTLILPTVLSIIYIGAFQESRQWGDIYTLLIFGVVGWTMKQLKWARPPLILGLVLGETIERYLFISVERFGDSWLTRPIVMALFGLALLGFLSPLYRSLRKRMAAGRPIAFQGVHFRPSQLVHVFLIAMLLFGLSEVPRWNESSRIVPVILGTIGLVFVILSLVADLLRPSEAEFDSDEIHMDLESDTGHLENRVVVLRAGIFFGWLIGLTISMAVIGLIPSIPIFVILFMRAEGHERWRLVLPQAIGITLFVYVVFVRIMHVPWPPTLLGYLVPALKFIPST
ncbi:tripartite tricarboxylate transporter permease [Ancylobacter sp. Lp-2]|uniref:tripartite tricarboxylate transporter permease n=1 Tax=Ancylobacter sp. Lp-2 TaxID=2881339 RepID=UPI001E4C2DC4|nr:tripartite tricarboxylate transporter permease [Ancylobacter sp. Lp-2]MCB4771577.1 tripartite tricarboxylate transporter permease [Ancylobacter sp. Lp-2]